MNIHTYDGITAQSRAMYLIIVLIILLRNNTNANNNRNNVNFYALYIIDSNEEYFSVASI